MASRREEQSLLGNSRSNGTSIVSSEFKNTKSMRGICPINQNVNKLGCVYFYILKRTKNIYIFFIIIMITNKYMEHTYIYTKGLSEQIYIICQYNSVSLIGIVNNNTQQSL